MCNDKNTTAGLGRPLTDMRRDIIFCSGLVVAILIAVFACVVYLYTQGVLPQVARILFFERLHLPSFMRERPHNISDSVSLINDLRIVALAMLMAAVLAIVCGWMKIIKLYSERAELFESVRRSRANQNAAKFASELMTFTQLAMSEPKQVPAPVQTIPTQNAPLTINHRHKFVFVDGRFQDTSDVPANAVIVGELNVLMAASSSHSSSYSTPASADSSPNK